MEVSRRFKSLGMHLTLALLLLPLGGCQEPQAPPTPPGTEPARESSTPPSLVIVLVDTQRADRSGPYGCPGGRTPELDRWAREGVQFVQATSVSPWTNPSVASLLTGLYPSTLRPAPKTVDRQWFFRWRFSEQALTLAEHLKEQGFQTAAFLANPFVSAGRGFAQGFDRFQGEMGHLPAGGILPMAEEWIRQEARPPFFLFLLLFDPHNPYDPPAPYDRLLQEPRAAESREIPLEELQAKPHIGLKGLRRVGEYLARYDGEIRYADAHLARVRRALAERGLDRSLVTVVGSDHGESFLERGLMGHRNNLHAEEVRVPLVITGPGIPRGRLVPGPVQPTDLFPTLCGILGIRRPEGLQGRDLGPRIHHRGGHLPAYLETNTRSVQRGIELEGWKLLRDSEGLRLFDLTTDPGERIDLAGHEPRRTRELEAMLQDWLRDQKAEELPALSLEEDQISEEGAGLLRSLGYVGS